METESPHVYEAISRLSNHTTSYYRKTRTSSRGQPSDRIPSSRDLIAIKQDVERLTWQLEKRRCALEKDLERIENEGGQSRKDQPLATDTHKHEKAASPCLEKVKQEESQETRESIDMDRHSAVDSHSPDHRSGTKHDDTPFGIPKLDVANKKREASPAYDMGQKQHVRTTSLDTTTSARSRSTTVEDAPVSSKDFARVRSKDQVSIQAFWTTMHGYFRPLTEEDRRFLLAKGDAVSPYLIPPLGRHYTELWSEDDALLGMDSTSLSSSPVLPPPSPQRMTAHAADETRSAKAWPLSLDHESLTDRLLSSLVREEMIDPIDIPALDDGDATDSEQPSSPSTVEDGKTVMDMLSEPLDGIVAFEERLKRELRFAGILGKDDIEWQAREDDDICVELRRANRELREQIKVNDKRKKRLLDILEQQLQYDQYQHMLDSLDAQVQQSYLKRAHLQASKKRKSQGGPIRVSLSENACLAMEKRRTWIQTLGAIFRHKDLSMPSQSIYPSENDPPS